MEKTTDQFDSLKFKPLSEGLGLNHFADGLPYSPAGRTKKTINQPIAFQYPAEKVERKMNRSSSARLDTPQSAASTTPSLMNPVASQSAAQTAQSNTLALEIMDPASLWRRGFAYAIDFALAASIFAGILWLSFSINGFDLKSILFSRAGLQFAGPFFLLYMVLYLSYFLIQEITWRKTIGKALLGIEIRSGSGFAVLGRVLCFFVAALPLGIGLMWYFFDERRRCWHDVITDSEVVSR